MSPSLQAADRSGDFTSPPGAALVGALGPRPRSCRFRVQTPVRRSAQRNPQAVAARPHSESAARRCFYFCSSSALVPPIHEAGECGPRSRGKRREAGPGLWHGHSWLCGARALPAPRRPAPAALWRCGACVGRRLNRRPALAPVPGADSAPSRTRAWPGWPCHGQRHAIACPAAAASGRGS
jgi:hypothetical protein